MTSVKRLIVYARVSTEEQEEGYSLQTQLQSCRNWARENNYKIVAEITDDFTGRTLERPGFSEVVSIIQAGEADAVITHMPDRLSRNLFNRISIREELYDLDVELISVTRGIFTPTPANRFVDNIEGAVAEYELELIRERTTRGRKAKAESGAWIGQGVIMYGYQKEGLKKTAELVIDEEEAETVRSIFNWYVHGDNGPLTIVDIIERLNGVRSKTGARWTRPMIYRILKNEAYTGTYHALKRTNKNGKTVMRPKAEWVIQQIPSIVSRELFNAAKAKLQAHARSSGFTRSAHEYLLSGKIRCACGHSVHARTSNVKSGLYLYYACSANEKYRAVRKCDLPMLRASVVDQLVWDWAVNRLKNFDLIVDSMTKEIVQVQARNETVYARVKNIDSRIADAQKQISRLIDLYANERIDPKYLDEKVDDLQRNIKDLQDEQIELLEAIEAVPSEEEIQEISEIAKLMKGAGPCADFKTRQAILSVIRMKVTSDREDSKPALLIQSRIGADRLVVG